MRKIENVTVRRGNTEIILKLRGIRDDIMRIETTEKTRGMGIPEYLTRFYDGETTQAYKANGWKVTILK